MIIVMKDRFHDGDDLIYEGYWNLERKLYKFFSMHFYNKNLGTLKFFFLSSAWLTFIGKNLYESDELSHLEKLINFTSFSRNEHKENMKDQLSGGITLFTFGLFSNKDSKIEEKWDSTLWAKNEDVVEPELWDPFI